MFQDFLLDSPAGACFVLQALARRPAPAGAAGTIEQALQQMALRAFADLLLLKADETIEQQLSFTG